MSDRIQELLKKISQELAANKQKAAIMGVLSVVLIVVVGRLFLSGSEPAPAAAVPLPAAAVAPVDPTAPQVRPVPQQTPAAPDAAAAKMLAASPVAASQGKDASQHLEGAAEKKKARKVAVQDLPRTPARDIFKARSWSQFPREGPSAEDDTQAGQLSASLWEKMRDAFSERRDRHAKELNEISDELTELKLQSTMIGSVPSAFISGRLVHVGDTINGFSVVRIEEKRVMLQKNGVTRPVILP
ncbi:MAG TPA: hypothetical protein VMV94_10810 [Phycisphaerae bacterium]|nr:hypothetical protein [Phycisphaerae bacterium]